MPHADSATVPAGIQTKVEFWEHVYSQLEPLLASQRNWVSNTANASALIYNALADFPVFGSTKRINWAGFYIHGSHFPTKCQSLDRLLLGPFAGKPACQYIQVWPSHKARGVCAEAFLKGETVIVANVEEHPGHISCDGETKSEIVCPLVARKLSEKSEIVVIGVLDLDCTATSAFSEEDRVGLQKIAQLVVDSCDW